MVVKPRVDNEGVDGDLDDVVNIGRPTPTLVILKPTPPMNNKYGSKKLVATFTFVTGISGPQGYVSALCRVVLLLVRRHKYITDNELAYLECIYLFVEILDHFFSNVCELDLVFNFHKVLVQTVREKDSTTFSGICIINLIFLSKFPNR